MRLEEYKITTSKELTKFIKRNTCTILKFSAKWCGPCKNKSFLDKYHNLKDKYAKKENIKFIEFDVDQDEQIINDTEYYLWEINSVPTFKIYHGSKRLYNHTGTSVISEIDKEIEHIINLPIENENENEIKIEKSHGNKIVVADKIDKIDKIDKLDKQYQKCKKEIIENF